MKKFILSLLAIITVAFSAKAVDVVDVLNQSVTGITTTSYSEFSGISVSSDAVYAGQCAGGNESIQLRSNNSNSGVVTTASGGIATKIVVEWNSTTSAGRTLLVYGSHDPFAAATDLYGDDDAITKIGEIVCGTDTELVLDEDESFEYIGFRSKSGAMYLSSVSITWSTGDNVTVPKPTLTASASFYGSKEITIQSENVVYYTTDGTDPTTSSEVYSEPFEITETTTVKAIAADGEGNLSAVAEATYTAIPKSTIAEAQDAEVGTTVAIEGTVVAEGDAGCVIYDGTDYLYYYAGTGNQFVTGDQVVGVGALSTYGGAKQLNAGSLTKTGTTTVTNPTAVEVTAAQMDEYQTAGVTPRLFGTFMGTLNINGKYYNITVDGAQNSTASIIKPLAEDQEKAAELDGKLVIVKGYLMYVNNSYVYFVATDVQEVKTELTNADFEADEASSEVGICTYVKDVGSNGTNEAQAQKVTGWTIVENGDARAAGTFVYGTDTFLGGKGYAAPAFSLFDNESKAFGMVSVWSAKTQYTQDVYLQPGTYMLQVPVFNSVGGTNAIAANLIGANGVYASTTQYPVGQWTVENIEFELTEAQMVTVSLGYTATNSGSGAMPHLFIESAKLYAGEEAIEAAKADADAAVEAFATKKLKADALAAIDGYGVGDGLFFYPQSAIDEAKAAVEAATTEEAIEQALATLNGKMNKPVEGQPYAVKNATAAGNLNVTEATVNVVSDAKVYFTEVEGGWLISSVDEAGVTEYIFKTTGNTWTLTGTTDASEAYVLSVNPVENCYTISGARGLLGLDNTEEGSTVYANKAIGNNGLWTIEEWVEPYEPEDMTSLIKNPAYLEADESGNLYANWTYSTNAFKARSYESPLNLITYSGNTAFEVSQTLENVPAGLYKLTVSAFYRAGSRDDEQNKLNEGTELEKELTMYATIGDDTYSKKVMNLSEGGDTESHDASDPQMTVGTQTLYVPDNASAARQWYIDGKYVNEVLFNVFEDGNVTIGLSKTVGLASDYCPIGAWTLTRLGDADETAATPDPVEVQPASTYEGKIATGTSMPDDPYTMVQSNVAEQTVTVTDAEEEGKVNITFSGYTFPLPPIATGEFTVVADKTVNSDGSVDYNNEGFTLSMQMGQMSVNYSGTLAGTQASADATPTIVVTLKNATTETSVFAATEEEATALLAEQYVEPTPEVTFEDGKYYLYNVASERWWGVGNNWGTQATLMKNPDYVTLISNDDGTYKLESQVSNGGTAYYFEGDYMDNGNPLPLTITALAEPFGYSDEEETEPIYAFTISNNDKYFGYDGQSTVLGKGLAADDEKAVWLIFTEEDMMKSLAEATQDEPADATFLIIDHTFGRNNRNQSAWNNPNSCAITGGNSNKHCAEKYHGVFNISQALENAPAGVYKFTAQGFYRQDGSDEENLPVFYISNGTDEATAVFPLKTGSENSMADACTSFEAGKYPADAMFIELAEGQTLTVGARLETNTTLWCIWDNFELFYYGTDADIDDVKFGDLIEQLDALRQLAEEQKEDENVSPATKVALDEALAATETVDPKTVENYQTAIATMTTPTEQAKQDINNKPAIDNMYKLMESTNVYTQDAYDTFKAAADAYLAAWEEGTLTETVVDPYAIQGWHFANNYDDFLLSAWGQTDFNSALYINTWSIEGESDGTDFKVPFFEYWTGDGDSLGENTWTATVTGLEPGVEYTVTSWTRVRRKNNDTDDPYGITFGVKDGEPVDLQNMQIVGDGPFFLAELSATGVADEDGNLVIQYVIDASNNISWLSFQNVNYAAPESSVLEKTLDLERTVGYGYGATWYEIDVEEAKAFLGVDELTYDMLRIVNPDDTEISDYAPYDGWFNANGVAAQWSPGGDTKICVKFFEAIPDGEFSICDMNNADVPDTTYTVKWALTANEKEIIYTINVTFVEPADVEIEVGDVVASFDVSYTQDDIDNSDWGYAEQVFSLSDEDVEKIVSELGISSLSDATVYGYNPTTGQLVANYDAYDGWRNADGDFANWSGTFAESPVCVKWDGNDFYTYSHPYGDTYVPGSYKVYWAFANDETAVLVEFNFTYEVPTGINGINVVNALENGNVFDLSGRKVSNVVKGNVYIVNGKKLLVK